MPTITIDDRPIEVPPEATVLDAARKLGIDVPTLCYLEGYKPSTSCQVCVVKLLDNGRVVPACGTRVVEGMRVASETPEVHRLRRTALELLLSDHVGDCLAPCFFACPAHMDVPQMLRQIGDEDHRSAIATIKEDIALPAILGRVCPKPCEKGCRRHGADGPVEVCELKRYVADRDLASREPYVPPCQPASGRHVAVVGAGPTGLAAAFHLRREGHAVTVFDAQEQPGGRLLDEFSEAELPRKILAAEVGVIFRLGVELRSGTRVRPAGAVRRIDLAVRRRAGRVCGAAAARDDRADVWRRGVGQGIRSGVGHGVGGTGLGAIGCGVGRSPSAAHGLGAARRLLCVFTHDKIREALLAHLPASQRTELHRRAARHLREHAPQRMSDLASISTRPGTATGAGLRDRGGAAGAANNTLWRSRSSNIGSRSGGWRRRPPRVKFQILRGAGLILMLRRSL